MGNILFIKCIKDTEGWWTEGKIYEAYRVARGFVMLGDDREPDDQGWIATPVGYRESGSMMYQIDGIEGEVLFEEAAQ